MGREKSFIDADFEVVSGPYRVGEEHRRRKGWYFTGHFDRHGDPIWYKPPPLISRIAAHIYRGMFVAIVVVVVTSMVYAGLKALFGVIVN